MSRLIKWGILGTGNIAHKFASDLSQVNNAKLVAVGSRSQSAANRFAGEFNIAYSHGSYEALAANSELDVIYIATPHVFHYENALLCLRNNKAVLCEKPFAINKNQVMEMIQTAKEQQVFLMEALWTKFLPHYLKMKELILQGAIGEVTCVQANFGFRPENKSPSRLLELSLGGGTLMDIGIYNVFLALSVLGRPDGIMAASSPAANGIDEQCAVSFTYKNGAMAQLFSSFYSTMPVEANIFGREGNMRLTDRFYGPSSMLQLAGQSGTDYKNIPVQKSNGWGYQYEAAHVTVCLLENLKESPVMSFDDSIILIDTLDSIRKLIGLKYEDE